MLFDVHGILYEDVASVEELKKRLSTIERVPDIVVTDYRLPDERTAEDVLALVWKQFETVLPTIVLTGEVAGVEAGALLSFPVRTHRKPIAPELLLEEISMLCHVESHSVV